MLDKHTSAFSLSEEEEEEEEGGREGGKGSTADSLWADTGHDTGADSHVHLIFTTDPHTTLIQIRGLVCE